MAASLVLCSGAAALAQDWSLSGNAGTVANNFLGTTDSRPIVFKTNGVERGRLTATTIWRFGTATDFASFDSGRLRFGGTGVYQVADDKYVFQSRTNTGNGLFYNALSGRYEFRNDASTSILTVDYLNNRVGVGTTTPSAKLHVNSASGEDGLRVQVAGSTKLLVNSAGGVSVGSLTSAPANGLFVSGNAGFGTATPEANLHILRGSAGVVTANANATLVVENSTSNYINMLTPDANERGIIFGDALNATDAGIYYGASNSMGFRTNGNVTRMTLSSTGDLDISGGSLSFGSVERFSDSGSNTIGTNSNIVPDLDGTSHSLGVSNKRWGSVWAIDGTINTSDLRSKKNIRNMEYGIKSIMQMRPVKFNWLNSANQEDKLGVIAQEMKKIVPEVVRDYEYRVNEQTGKEEKVPAALMGVMYSDLIPVLIKGIQEQQQMINELQDRLAKLENTPSTAVANTSNASAAQVNKTTAASIKVMPNPAHNIITVTGLQNAGTITVSTLDGKQVMQQQVNANTALINIGSLPNGTYALQYVHNNAVQNLKFIKQ